jgi:hypothetical protein
MVAKQQRYFSGEPIHAGDVIRYGRADGGIVFVNDTAEYIEDFTAKDWSYLGSGFMMRQENGALIFLEESDDILQFIRRA